MFQEINEKILSELESGEAKVVEFKNDKWNVNTEIKNQILTLFKTSMHNISCGEFIWQDKLEWLPVNNAKEKNYRMCPGSWIRRGVHIESGVIFMPCFVNVGAHVGESTMIDSGATIGSCAYIGKKCHISANVVIAGVLEPVQDCPTIIEDHCFIGAQSLISEGFIVGHNSVIGAGTILTQSTKVIDRNTGQMHYGIIPPYSVVVPGSYKSVINDLEINIACAVIVKTLNPDTVYSKLDLNEILRQ